MVPPQGLLSGQGKWVAGFTIHPGVEMNVGGNPGKEHDQVHARGATQRDRLTSGHGVAHLHKCPGKVPRGCEKTSAVVNTDLQSTLMEVVLDSHYLPGRGRYDGCSHGNGEVRSVVTVVCPAPTAEVAGIGYTDRIARVLGWSNTVEEIVNRNPPIRSPTTKPGRE